MTWTDLSPDDPLEAEPGDRPVLAHGRHSALPAPRSSIRAGLGLTRRDWRLAFRDLTGGARARHLWLLLGTNDIRLRYKRSRFGQFWITLSMALFIGRIGVVYSALFKQPVGDYIPYLAVTVTVWTLISGVIGDSSTVFTQAAIFMRQDRLPRSIFVLRILVRNLIVLAHNLAIVPLAFLLFLYAPSPIAIAALPGLALLFGALFLSALLVGLLSTRFRDLPQIVQNALQLLFFVTPVMWRADQVTGGREALLALNPFASLLAIVSEPLLGRLPPPRDYAVTAIVLVVLVCLTLPLFARCRGRLVYWL